jgi:hypothetical protein
VLPVTVASLYHRERAVAQLFWILVQIDRDLICAPEEFFDTLIEEREQVIWDLHMIGMIN